MNFGSYRSALFGPVNTKKSLPKFTIGDRACLERRIHTNPKYQSVSCKTDTGFNSRKKEELQREIKKYYKVSNNEIFSRICLDELMQLAIAHSQEFHETQPDVAASAVVLHSPNTPDDDVDTVTQMENLKAKLDCSPAARDQEDVSQDTKAPIPPYLLVDVRPSAEYCQKHMIGAVSHELSKLSRSVNWESRELLLYRNSPDKLIILYDMNEDIVSEYAGTLIHRGYENVYVLSGGLKLADDKFGFPLVVSKRDTSTVSKVNVNSTEVEAAVDTEVSNQDLLLLKNEVLPLGVIDVFVEQLGEVIIPPLSIKPSERVRSLSSGRGPGSVISTSRSTRGSASVAAVSIKTSDKSVTTKKPWR